MLLAQISDPHIVENGRKTLNIAPTAENLSAIIDDINSRSPRPDAVVVSGDVTDTGSIKDTRNAVQILNALEIPYFVIPGNHDEREILWQYFKGNACPALKPGFINYVIDDFEVRLIALDSTIAGADGGELCTERLDWLDKALAAAPDRPTIIFMHHPPLKLGVLETDVDGFIGMNELAKIVAQYSNIERICCGHIHLPTHSRWNGTIVSTAPSSGMRLGLDLSMKKTSEFYFDAPAYQLHHWTVQKKPGHPHDRTEQSERALPF